MEEFELKAAMMSNQKVYFKKQQPTYVDMIVGTVVGIIHRKIEGKVVQQAEIRPENGANVNYVVAWADVKPCFAGRG